MSFKHTSILSIALATVLSLTFFTSLYAGDATEASYKAGDTVSDAKPVAIAEVIKAPEKYTEKPVIVEGTIAEVCRKKGCWMELMPVGAETAVRVTFKDYGFFVPTDSQGMLVRVEGVFETKVWSKEDVDHLVGEGATMKRNPDGTATELSFVANGVELRPAKKASAEAASE